MNKTTIKIFYLLAVAGLCVSINASNKDFPMTGYWLTSQSIVHVKECEKSLCAVIEHIFVEIGIDPESILDKNNKDKSMSCLLYTSPSPRDRQKSRMPSSA